MVVFLSSGKGDHNENKFLATGNKRTRATPKWFVGVRRSSGKFDVKGIDMIAKIQRSDDKKPMSVPIQVKSSEWGKRSFYEKYPEARRLGVPVIVIGNEATGEEIRDRLYQLLAPFLLAKRDHFKEYFDEMARARLSRRGKELKAHILGQRRKG